MHLGLIEPLKLGATPATRQFTIVRVQRHVDVFLRAGITVGTAGDGFERITAAQLRNWAEAEGKSFRAAAPAGADCSTGWSVDAACFRGSRRSFFAGARLPDGRLPDGGLDNADAVGAGLRP